MSNSYPKRIKTLFFTEESVRRYGNETLQCFVRTDTLTLDSWLKQKKREVTVDETLKNELVYQNVSGSVFTIKKMSRNLKVKLFVRNVHITAKIAKLQ